ncbi:MAG TPA: hypothetical protein VLB74_11970 [Flavobacterium sp.]|uniref:hypothetical protein n=1 Tax=Flavobacterium sp. TaxID=239 RepID=UPI002C369B59|nr:hypothetical protein [Flavobacterium sp.]HSD15357.1 hypothetical protein [Flavobacterium sp.]
MCKTVIKAIFLFLLLAFYNTGFSQPNGRTKYWVDKNGKKVSKFERGSITEKENLAWAIHKSKDSGNVATLKNPRYQAYETKYDSIKSYFQKATNREFKEGTIFLISYYYKDDFCSDFSTNHYKKSLINDRKTFLSEIKNSVETNNKNIIYFVFFDNGIKLDNDFTSEKEFFFTDTDNFLRRNLMTSPTLCGSELIIKPDGTALVRNGEYRADWMANHLKPEIWNSFFESE